MGIRIVKITKGLFQGVDRKYNQRCDFSKCWWI